MVPVAELANVQVPLSVTVTTLETVEPVVVLVHVPVKEPPNVTLGEAGTVKADGKAMATVSPDARAPPDEAVKLVVHELVEWAVAGDPLNVTLATSEPEPVMVVELTAVAVSADVETVYWSRYWPAPGFVTAEMVSDNGYDEVAVHAPPVFNSVNVTLGLVIVC
jgi:hypothetical protein